jgi:hypothetical protein
VSALSQMIVQASLALDATPTPMPAYEGDPNLITPGVFGFIAIFVVALATVFLLLDMTRRIRRTRYRGMVQEQIALENEAPEAPKND